MELQLKALCKNDVYYGQLLSLFINTYSFLQTANCLTFFVHYQTIKCTGKYSKTCFYYIFDQIFRFKVFIIYNIPNTFGKNMIFFIIYSENYS